MGGTILGVPRIRTIVFWGLYWGPLILGNYQIPKAGPMAKVVRQLPQDAQSPDLCGILGALLVLKVCTSWFRVLGFRVAGLRVSGFRGSGWEIH